MTTYSPVGPFTLDTDQDTGPLLAIADDEIVDALPRLDIRLLEKTIAPELVRRGWHLAFSQGKETRLLRLDGDVIHLGRGPSADIGFDDARVSRDHAIIVRHGEHLRLLDNHSANGTFVGDRRVAATNLCDGDVIDLGPVRMQLIEVA